MHQPKFPVIKLSREQLFSKIVETFPHLEYYHFKTGEAKMELDLELSQQRRQFAHRVNCKGLAVNHREVTDWVELDFVLFETHERLYLQDMVDITLIRNIYSNRWMILNKFGIEYGKLDLENYVNPSLFLKSESKLNELLAERSFPNSKITKYAGGIIRCELNILRTEIYGKPHFRIVLDGVIEDPNLHCATHQYWSDIIVRGECSIRDRTSLEGYIVISGPKNQAILINPQGEIHEFV